jgi:hypothetical protein
VIRYRVEVVVLGSLWPRPVWAGSPVWVGERRRGRRRGRPIDLGAGLGQPPGQHREQRQGKQRRRDQHQLYGRATALGRRGPKRRDAGPAAHGPDPPVGAPAADSGGRKRSTGASTAARIGSRSHGTTASAVPCTSTRAVAWSRRAVT